MAYFRQGKLVLQETDRVKQQTRRKLDAKTYQRTFDKGKRNSATLKWCYGSNVGPIEAIQRDLFHERVHMALMRTSLMATVKYLRTGIWTGSEHLSLNKNKVRGYLAESQNRIKWLVYIGRQLGLSAEELKP